MEINNYKVVDLFSGGVGLSLGFINANFDVVAAYDHWEAAINFYNKNFKSNSAYKVDLKDKEVINFIKKKSPFHKAKEAFKKAGYGLTIAVLNASLCGVPQLRKRLFVIGSLFDGDNFLDSRLTSCLSTKPMTIREYLKNSIDIEHYYRHPRSYKRRAIFSIDEPSPTIRGVNRPIPSGYKGHSGDTTTDYKNLRPLTTKERSIIQTFPIEFDLSGNKTDIEQIIGNAVPVKLSEYVALRLKEHILESSLH
ncbi:MAG TPA: DNA cytosine methyltransferase [bacterium]|nr:DNA cytosine methyltransferase [bacterium]HPN31332.1 DNA cytosine methyltransferase [bacterium]